MRFGKSVLIAVLASLSVAAAYSGYWYYARGLALEAVADWLDLRREEGYRVLHDPIRTEGFPFVIRVLLKEPSVAAPDEIWRWRGERLTLEAQPWNLYRYRLEFHGAQEIMLERDGAPYSITLESREATAIAGFWRDGQPKAASVLLREVRVSGGPGDWRAEEVWMEATRPEFPPATHTETALTLSVNGSGIEMPADFNAPLGRMIEMLRGDFRLLGVIRNGPVEQAVEGWRRDGGTIEVPWLRAIWGRVDLRAQGGMALDEDWRPMGAFSANIRGYAAGMDALADTAVIEPKTAAMAKIGLALLAKRPPEGGEPVLTVPVTAQSGQLYAGPVRIADLPRIRISVPRH
ncbi:MAG: DUF2125 domain-containing protein [Alphaproteobacteria bacterium]